MLYIWPRLRLVAGIERTAFAIIVISVLLFLCGCGGHGFVDSARDAANGAASAGGSSVANADPFLRDLRSVLIPISWGAIALGIIGFAVSYFVPLIPRQSAIVSIGCGIGCLVLLGLVAKFSGFIAWSLLITGVLAGLAAGVPFLFGLFRWSQRKNHVDLEPGPGPGGVDISITSDSNFGGGISAKEGK